MQIDGRKMLILSTVVDEYIKTGEPVGSNSVLNQIGISVSSATVRNDMALLERQGFLEQPHTSAGRIPTYLGFRFYIEHLMSPKPLSLSEKSLIDSLFNQNTYTAETIVEKSVCLLSDLTQLAVVSKNNMPVFSVITRVDVIPAGRRLYALLIITSAGSIKNKICRLEFDITNEQLEFFAKFMNDNLTGLNFESLTPIMLQKLILALGSYMMTLSPLVLAVYELSEEMAKSDIHVKGEQMLLTSDSLNAQEVISMISHKDELHSILANAFDGVSIIFGKETDSFAVTNSSMILSQYNIRNDVAGSLGVIGPIRVDYAKIIPHIQYITDSMTKLLSEVIDDDSRKDD